MEKILLISDAAKEVEVESHVLRYWEDELKLPIKRNELGHRYYTKEDVERFKQIKAMKEQGLQLKAIKMILKDGRLNVISVEGTKSAPPKSIQPGSAAEPSDQAENTLAISVISEESKSPIDRESNADKVKRLQWLLQQMIRESLQENNKELSTEISKEVSKEVSREVKEGIVKELDYQFRTREEKEEERERRQTERTEEYYRKMDEILRMKSSEKNDPLIEIRKNQKKNKKEHRSFFAKRKKEDKAGEEK